MKYLLLILFLTGCSYTREIGVVGNKRFTKVQLGSLTAPAQTLIVVEDICTHETTITTPMGGNGVVPGLLQAGGIVGGAVALGNTLDTGNTSMKTIIHEPTIVDEPPAPPIYPPRDRPPANRPPPKKGNRK